MRQPTIVWDFNGTLLDDLQACLDALNVILRSHRLPPLSREDYRRRFGFPVVDFYTSLGLQPKSAYDWEALAESFHMRYLFSRHLKLQPGAREALGYFRRRGIRQGVLSALEQGILEMQLNQFALTEPLAFICGSRNYDGASKLDAARKLALEEPVILVGDTLHDAEVATALGWRCILCAAGHQTADRLAASGHPVIATLAELAPAVDALFPKQG